jgi:hypothetical protein
MRTELALLGKRMNMAPQVNRRWLVALMYCGQAAFVAAWLCGWLQSAASLLTIMGLLFMMRLLGGGSSEGGVLAPFDSNDEREIPRRDHAHYVAYRQIGYVLVAALFTAYFNEQNPFTQQMSPAIRVFVERLPYGVLLLPGCST